MAMPNAIRFLRDLETLREVRDLLFECSGLEEVYASLREAGYAFTQGEFEEAAQHLLDAGPSEEIHRLREKIHTLRLVFAFV